MMRPVFVTVCCLVLVAGAARADDLQTCTARRADLTRQAASFQGDARQKRLIDADLRRPGHELAEGDGDECLEALDHAARLLTGRD